MDSDLKASYHEEKDNKNRKFVDNIIDDIKENKNYTITCKIIEDKKEGDYNFMTIKIHNIDYFDFVRKNNNDDIINRYIKFELYDLKVLIINNKSYLNIKQYEILKNEKGSNGIEIYNLINEIKDNANIFSIKLKAKEVFDTLTITKFIFQDLNGNSINIINNEDYKFENGKIYFFCGYFYNKNEQKLNSTYISSIQQYKNDKDKINPSKDIIKYNIGKCVNLKGKIKSYSLIDKYIMLEDSEKNIFKVKLNINLFKKISLNGLCYFYNFSKTNKNEFEMTLFSDIETEEETYIEFIFDDFDKENNFYNRITIDDMHYNINEKIMKIKLNDNNKKNIFIQDIVYEKIENEKVKNCYNFSLEVEKGKINHFNSLLYTNGNHSYQLIFQVKHKQDLPKAISLNINNKDYAFNNPDKFGNDLIERFTIINVPELDISKLLNLSVQIVIDENKKEGKNDFKFLISINDKHKKDLKIFIKTKNENNKEYFNINENEFEIIKKIFDENIYSIKNKDSLDVLKPLLVVKNKKECEKIINLFDEGFKKYNFKNNRHDYEMIKYLSLIDLCLVDSPYKNSYINDYKDILNKLYILDYIDRIKIIIYFVTIFNDNNKKDGENDKVTYEQLTLFDLDNKDIFNNYPYINKAYNEFYKIIDNLKEECPLYQGILQLNSFIYPELISDNSYHSGSILNVDDIKLELLKNTNRFLILSLKDDIYSDDFAEYSLESKTSVIYLSSIFRNKRPNDKKYFNIASSVILILFIHEKCGHQKKNTNNDKLLTPRYHEDSNFQNFGLDRADSGDAIEYLLINNFFDIDQLMNNKETEKLLDASLYYNNNFDRLRSIYNKIIEENKIKIGKKDSDANFEEDEEDKKKKKIDKKELNRKNLSKKPKVLMFRELKIMYLNLTDEEKKNLAGEENYERYLKIYEKKKKKYK